MDVKGNAVTMANARYAELPALGLGEVAGDLLGADDTTLARALKAGDSRAPRVAWLRFRPLVYRTLRRTFGLGHDVEDLQQDIFLAFFSKVSGLRNPDALRPFLMSIAVRTINSQFRRLRVRRIILFLESPENIESIDAPWVESPDHTTHQTLAAFHSVLNKLNARDRTLFGLRFLEGMELSKVAAALGLSLSTVKRQLARIWKRVARRIRNEPALASDRRGWSRRIRRNVDTSDEVVGPWAKCAAPRLGD